ncbi:MAG: hypothetical protein SXA11_05455 [Cyanobacteriota bacterium]|nr:hypothetical protein [Cyanobacteriota bacterium]
MKLPNLQLYNSYGFFNKKMTHESIYHSDKLLLEEMFCASICLKSKNAKGRIAVQWKE